MNTCTAAALSDRHLLAFSKLLQNTSGICIRVIMYLGLLIQYLHIFRPFN